MSNALKDLYKLLKVEFRNVGIFTGHKYYLSHSVIWLRILSKTCFKAALWLLDFIVEMVKSFKVAFRDPLKLSKCTKTIMIITCSATKQQKIKAYLAMVVFLNITRRKQVSKYPS